MPGGFDPDRRGASARASRGMRLTGIDHVQLGMPVGQEERAREFYGGVLDLKEVAKPVGLAGRGGVWFVGAGVNVHLGVEDPFCPSKRAHTAFLVTDLAGFASCFKAGSIAFEMSVDHRDRPRLYVNDPFGNRLELIKT